MSDPHIFVSDRDVEGDCTLQLSHVHSKLIAFLKNSFPASSNELVEAVGKARHAVAKLLEAKINVGK